ncbi:MAG: hypothetical protein U0W24_03830 [Bacteroidales bacterium]
MILKKNINFPTRKESAIIFIMLTPIFVLLIIPALILFVIRAIVKLINSGKEDNQIERTSPYF